MTIDDLMDTGSGFPRYKLSKTVRFELKPVGRTLQTFKEKFLGSDQRRADDYPKVKELLDNMHKQLLEDALSSMPALDWDALALAYDVYARSDKGKDAKDTLKKCQEVFRKKIVEHIKNDDRYGLLSEATPNKLFKSVEKEAEESGKPLPEELKTFLGFACYFKGYQENRLNIYSDQPQATAAANRAINENFPKFLQDVAIVKHIADAYPKILSDAEAELGSILKGRNLVSLFDVGAYGAYLAQSGVEFFNSVLSGFVTDAGEKTKGLNEFINLYRQQHEEVRSDRKLAPLHPLYKQILSDRVSTSFVPRMFENDDEALASLDAFFFRYLKEIEGNPADVLDELERHVGTVSLRDGIWIDSSELAFVSKECFDGDWSLLKVFAEEDAERRFAGESTEKKRLAAIEKWMKRPAYELSEFRGLKVEHDEGTIEKDISELWRGEKCKAVFNAARTAISEVKSVLACGDGDKKLRERKEDVQKIKAALDSVMDVLHFVKPLHAGDGIGQDESFYGPFDALYDALCAIVPLYNKVRNYLTKKFGDAERIKLMFDKPTLAHGWDLNKEKDNKCVLFFKDGIYYLGVMGPKNNMDFSKLVVSGSADSYSKMTYKLLPNPNQMLPKVFFSEKGIKIYHPTAEMIERYKAGDYKKGSSFDLKFCRELIDFFKACINMHPDWSKFGFVFSPTSSYEGIDAFYREIAEQGYRISFEDIPSESVDRLVEEGKLCLFKLWSKDFSANSTGRPNLHTQYWRAAFDPKNLKDVVIKLNGEAELFYRRTVIKEPFRHKVGEKMLNRRTQDGESIPETVHKEIVDCLNGKKNQDELSAVAKELMRSGRLVIKDVKHEIVKDRRYAEDKFAFHVPLTFNFKEPDSPKKFNDAVRAFVNGNPDVNIIGIDRGERNLLYLVMINQKGEVLEQFSLNEIGGREGQSPFDYHAKLDQLEKDRDIARKTWAEIGGIKDLKEGYLSQVVHRIAQMIVEHNAIVVLEDLNFGFKRGRFRIEKQVYQKFEKALITKLNYLVFKERGMSEPGGVLNAYQLTAPFESFEKLGKQTGFIFYVPAGYTSKIDPTTGFTNLFNTKKCTNAKGIKEFFLRFDSIRYEAHRQAFAFSFNYDNFKTGQEDCRKKWTVYTATRRLVYRKDLNSGKGGYDEINPTAILLNALSKMGVEVCDGFDLLDYVKNLEPSRENADFFRKLFYSFDRTLQMRNSMADEDYIESSVLNGNGEMFDSRKSGVELPKDADANGAYHIALKGLMLVKERMIAAGKAELKIEHKDWFRFAQGIAERRFGK